MTAPQDPALPAGLLHSLRDLLTQPDEPLPPGDVREVAVDALGLIGLGALVMLAITVLAVPRASGAVIAVSALFVVLPLLLRESVKRRVGVLTAPLTLACVLALGIVWWQSLAAPNAVIVLDPFNQAGVLAGFGLLTVLCVASVRRYVGRTHRRAMEERAQRVHDAQLQLLNEKLQLAIQSGDFGVWEYDVAARTFRIDAQQSRIYGLPEQPHSVSTDKWLRAVHRDDRARVRRWLDDTTQAHLPYDMSFRIVRPDQAVRWLRSIGKAQLDDAGRVVRVVGLDRDVTAQEEADMRLRALSERMLLATGAAQLGIWELDALSGDVSADAAVRRLFGLPAAAHVVREDVRACIHPEDQPVIRDLVDHGLHSAEPLEARFRVQAANGSVRWLRSAASMPRDAGGAPRRMVGVCWDITRDVELQEKLAESSRRQALALQAVGGAAWAVHGDDGRLRWSDHWFDLFGVAGSAPAETWLERVVPEDSAGTRTRWQHSLRAGAEPEFAWEFRIHHPSRGLRVMRCVGRCEFDAAARLSLAFGIVLDVTARRAAAAEVRQLTERLDLAAAASGMGTWQYEPASGTLGWDRRHARLLGLRGDDEPDDGDGTGARGADLAVWQQCVAEGDRAALLALVQGSPGAPERIEIDLLPQPGQAQGRRLRVMAQAVHDERGTLLKRAGAAFDITREWHAQQAIERARQEAEAASRSKSAFLANMSHEIRTPMNAVIGLTGLLLDAVQEQPAHDYAAKGHAAARSLLAVLDDVLDLSKIEAGKLELERTEFRIADVLTSVRDLLAHAAEAKRLPLRVEVVEGLGEWWSGDRTRLQQILLNLGSNAVKFTERGEVVLRAGVAGTQGGGGAARALRFEVEDSGIGMSPEAQARIFDAFEQADVSTSRRFGGTGLGLTICRHLVARMGGELGLASVPGRGTRMWFTLAHLQPALRQGRAEPPSGASAAALAEAPSRLTGACVLLVEDNELNRLVGVAMLEQLGVQVRVVESGEAALALLLEQTVDVVLMDIQMPGMDGLEATRRIRAMPSRAGRMPIIAMTAHAMSGDRELSLAAGMNDHVTKPIERDALGAVLERWLSDGSGSMP